VSKQEECQGQMPSPAGLGPGPGRHPEAPASGPKSLPRAKPRGSRAQYFDLTRAAPSILPTVTGRSRFFCLTSSSCLR